MTCSASVRKKRHNALRNLLAGIARGANLHCMCEQKLDIGAEALADPAEARPLHSCDLEILDPEGGHSWIDVRAVTHRALGDVDAQLIAAERQKLAEYGIRDDDLGGIKGRLVPFILEAHGRMSPRAKQLMQFLVRAKVAHVTQALGLSLPAAWSQVRYSIWQPISVLLLRSMWQCSLLSAGNLRSFAAADQLQALRGAV